ncbi:MAG: hypothetical protein ACPGJV_01420 [Bacteriovoracaceae bacterium]
MKSFVLIWALMTSYVGFSIEKTVETVSSGAEILKLYNKSAEINRQAIKDSKPENLTNIELTWDDGEKTIHYFVGSKLDPNIVGTQNLTFLGAIKGQHPNKSETRSVMLSGDQLIWINEKGQFYSIKEVSLIEDVNEPDLKNMQYLEKVLFEEGGITSWCKYYYTSVFEFFPQRVIEDKGKRLSCFDKPVLFCKADVTCEKDIKQGENQTFEAGTLYAVSCLADEKTGQCPANPDNCVNDYPVTSQIYNSYMDDGYRFVEEESLHREIKNKTESKQ